MYRTRKTNQFYKPEKRREDNSKGKTPCPFCGDTDRQIVNETKYSLVLKNEFSYQYWEFLHVTDHLMIIPKRHVESMLDLTEAEQLDLANQIAEYDEKGYNSYTRGKGTPLKSVPHLHTHLIKTKGGRARFVIFSGKPYFIFRR